MTGKKGETPSNEGLISDSWAMNAERRMQPRFSFVECIQLVALVSALAAIWHYLDRRPNRSEHGPRRSLISFTPSRISPADVYPLKLAGAWELSGADPRFGGFSGLAIDGGALLALTDRGSVARLPKPDSASRTATIEELPDGPYSGAYNSNRDTEAIVRDPLGRRWWVAFEKHHELWLYDPAFTRGLKRIELGRRRWPVNVGIEGLVALPGPELLLFAEGSSRLFDMRESRAVAVEVSGRRWKISEAAKLPDGRIVGIERRFTATGFQNALVTIERAKSGYRIGARVPLRVGWLDNIEGMAGEMLPGGTIRLWMISDDNFQRPLRTLLLAVDLPPERKPL